jgi:elongation factor G
VGGKKSKGGGKSSGLGGAGDDKLTSALAAMAREDLALRVEHDAASGKLMVRCMSGDHLKLVAARLQDRYGLEVQLGHPPVQYRETLVKAVSNMEGRHKKQSGGSGQFGVCYISMEPLEEGSGIEFESQIKGGVISKPFISAVEKGVYEQLQSGGPLGYPVTDVRVILTDGKMHSVDSKDIAFQSAGKQAVKAALDKAGTRLLQPMEKVTFLVDEKLQGEVTSIVSRQDGYVTTVSPSAERSDLTEIDAILPTASIAEVSEFLRAESAGEGRFTSVFSHYQPVPDNTVKEIVGTTLHP